MLPSPCVTNAMWEAQIPHAKHCAGFGVALAEPSATGDAQRCLQVAVVMSSSGQGALYGMSAEMHAS